MNLVLMSLLIVIVSLVIVYLNWKFSYWKLRGVPYVEPTIPFGNAKGLGKYYSLSDLMRKVYQQLKPLGPIGGIYLYLRPTAIVTNLDLVKQILINDFNTFPNRGNYYNEKDDPVSAHMFNSEDNNWKKFRPNLTPTFTSGKLKIMFDTIVNISDELIQTLDRKIVDGQVEIEDLMSRFTTDVIGSVAFGIDCNSLIGNNAKFFEIGTKFLESISFFERFMTMEFRTFARMLSYKNTPNDIAKFYVDVTKEAINYRVKNKDINRDDFLSLLVKMKNSNAITENEILAQLFMLFLAGYVTSSTTMSFFIYEMALNEVLQDKTRQNIKNTIGMHGGKFSYEAVKEMNYLEQVLSETLRKHPASPNLQRVANKDYAVPNTNIILEKGVSLIIPIYAIHWDPELYPEPEKFDPDRFLPEEIAKRHQCAFIPFGAGQRMCIAKRFAYMETKIGLAKLLLNYKFTLDRTKTSVPIKIAPNKLFLSPGEGVFVNVEKI